MSAPTSQAKKDESRLLFRRHISHLSVPLYPLLSITTGEAHPAFPASILHYHLLSAAQLDDLAHFYHQRTPSTTSFSYPAPVVSRWRRDAGVDEKRRRFGRFMGLRGCESPGINGGYMGKGVRGVGEKGKIEEKEDEEKLERECEEWLGRYLQERLRGEGWRAKGF